MKYKYIFVILVYRNADDLYDCLKSIQEKVNDYKIIIVNSFYDYESEKNISEIAYNYGCEFLSVENKGYGAGNNKGIEYALSKYDFDYIVLSNPDIIIEEFTDEVLKSNKDCVVAPLIKTLNGKSQNPYWMYKCSFAEWLIYQGQKHGNTTMYYVGVAINKIIREIGLKKFLSSPKKFDFVYATHGSFVFFPHSLFDKIGLFYDENMFLFAEEPYIAHVFEDAGIKSIITKDVKILHKEDGSMKISKIDENSEAQKSIIYYYEKIKSISERKRSGGVQS